MSVGSDDEGHFSALIGHRPSPVSSIPREAQPFQGHRAGLVTRFTADAIDFGVLLVLLAAIYALCATVLFLSDPRSFTFPTVTVGQSIVAGWFVLGAYLTFGWWLSGRTYGKHVMGLRVVSHDGGRMHFIGAALRAAFCVAFPLGLFWVLVSPANRSVQDVALRSSVVYDWTIRRSEAGAAELR